MTTENEDGPRRLVLLVCEVRDCRTHEEAQRRLDEFRNGAACDSLEEFGLSLARANFNDLQPFLAPGRGLIPSVAAGADADAADDGETIYLRPVGPKPSLEPLPPPGEIPRLFRELGMGAAQLFGWANHEEHCCCVLSAIALSRAEDPLEREELLLELDGIDSLRKGVGLMARQLGLPEALVLGAVLAWDGIEADADGPCDYEYRFEKQRVVIDDPTRSEFDRGFAYGKAALAAMGTIA